MQSFPLELLMIPSGTRQNNPPGAISGSSNEFESILQTTLGAAGVNRDALLGSDALKGGLRQVSQPAVLNEILDKLNQIMQEGGQGISPEDLERMMADHLSEDELALLTVLLPNDISAEFGAVIEDNSGSVKEKQPEAESLLLEKLIEAGLLQQNGPLDNKSLEALKGVQTVLKTLLQKSSSVPPGIQNTALAKELEEGFDIVRSDQTSLLADKIVSILKEAEPLIQQEMMNSGAPVDLKGTDSIRLMVLMATIQERLAQAGAFETNSTGDPMGENLLSLFDGQTNNNSPFLTEAGLIQQNLVSSGVIADEGNPELQKAIEQLLKLSQNRDRSDLNISREKLDQLIAALQGRSNGKSSLIDQSLLNDKPVLEPFKANLTQQATLLMNRLQQGAGVTGDFKEQTITLTEVLQGGLNRSQIKQFVSSGSEQTEKTSSQSLLSETIQSLNLGEKAESAGKTAFKAPVNTQYVVDQITERVGTAFRQGENRIAIQLFPPSLGKLNITLAVKQNQLRAVIMAESQQVKHILETNIDQLRNTLESQNIEVEKLSVHVGQEGDRHFASLLRERSGGSKKNSFSGTRREASEDDEVEKNNHGVLPVHTMGFKGGVSIDLFV